MFVERRHESAVVKMRMSDGNCLNDADGDGVCDEYEVLGCTDPTNPGFNPWATDDDGSCLVGGCTLSFACNYDPNADYMIFTECDFVSCQGCTDETACNYDLGSSLDDGSCVYPEDGYNCDGTCVIDTDGDGVCDGDEVLGCTDPTNPGFNPWATEDDGSCLVGGCIIPVACNYDPNADFLDPSLCDFTSCADCMDAEACNYNPNAVLSNGDLCVYPVNQFVDCNGDCIVDTDGDGVCDVFEIYGCTDSTAVNYNVDATEDNGTCVYPEVGGCTLTFACNYDPNADYYLPGSCDFSCLGAMPIGGGACLDVLACNFGAPEACVYFDENGDLCAQGGCNSPGACNFDPDASYNDGSCEYLTCTGCMNPNACDFDPTATITGACYDYTSCLGCMEVGADNYDPEATIAGSCEYGGCTIFGACNFDSTANTNDGSCDFTSCIGCLNPAACDYDPTAIYAGSCTFPEPGLTCEGGCVSDVDGDGICDEDEVGGCTDVNALNYDSAPLMKMVHVNTH